MLDENLYFYLLLSSPVSSQVFKLIAAWPYPVSAEHYTPTNYKPSVYFHESVSFYRFTSKKRTQFNLYYLKNIWQYLTLDGWVLSWSPLLDLRYFDVDDLSVYYLVRQSNIFYDWIFYIHIIVYLFIYYWSISTTIMYIINREQGNY